MHHHLAGWIAPAVLLTMLAALSAAARARPDSFSLILERNGTEWSAACESGCAWGAISSRRPRLLGTSIVIDSYGVRGWGQPNDSASFAFKVSADGRDGWKAEGLMGTAWTKLTFKCADSPCRARITEKGVEGIP